MSRTASSDERVTSSSVRRRTSDSNLLRREAFIQFEAAAKGGGKNSSRKIGRELRRRVAPRGEKLMPVVGDLVDLLEHRNQLRSLGVTRLAQRLCRRVQELVGESAREQVERLLGRHSAREQPAHTLEL